MRQLTRALLTASILLPSWALALTEDEAVLLTGQGPRWQSFYTAYLDAKRNTRSTGEALWRSSQYVASLSSPPALGLAGALVDPGYRGESLLAGANLFYNLGDWQGAGRLLSRIPNEFLLTHGPGIESLRIRLALRGVANQVSVKNKPALSGNSAGLNQTLLLLAQKQPKDALQHLDQLAQSTGASEATKGKARLWASLIRSAETSAKGTTTQPPQTELPDWRGDHPMAMEWLLTKIRSDGQLVPEAGGAIAAAIEERMPDSLAALEAQERLIELLAKHGAHTQALAQTQQVLERLQGQISATERRLAGLVKAPLQQNLQDIADLDDEDRHRIQTLLERRREIRQAIALLDRWLPHIKQLNQDLRLNQRDLSDDIQRQLIAPQSGVGASSQPLFNRRITELMGTPPSRETRDRLFFGLTQWELGYEFPEYWRLGQEQSTEIETDSGRRVRRAPNEAGRRETPKRLMELAVEHANTLTDRFSKRLTGDAALGFSGIQDRTVEAISRERTQNRRLKALLAEIDPMIRQSISDGLKNRRRQLQQWQIRLAHNTEQSLRLGQGKTETITFDLSQRLRLNQSETLSAQLAKIQTARRPTRAAEAPDVKVALQITGDLSSRGETREMRALALKTRARVLLGLSGYGDEKEQRARQNEVIAHLESLATNYRDLTEPADVIYQLAYAYEVMGRRDDTLAQLRRLIADFPRDRRAPEAQLRIGEILFAMGDVQQARAAYEPLVRRNDPRFRDHADYMIAWCNLKSGDYTKAVERFIAVIDRATDKKRTPEESSAAVNRLQDTFRGLTLSLASLGGAEMLARYFPKTTDRQYAQEVYASMGQYYLDHRNITDATSVYRRMIENFPRAAKAPSLLVGLSDTARQENLFSAAFEYQEEFSRAYAKNTPYWRSASAPTQDEISKSMLRYLPELGQRYHAEAQRERNPDHFAKAIAFYGQLVTDYPASPNAGRMRFLRAEAKNETGDTAGAIADYEAAAYLHGQHPDRGEAGYASLVATQTWVAQEANAAERQARLKVLVQRSDRFVQTFPGDRRAGAVLMKAAEDMLALGDAAGAARLGKQMLATQGGDAQTLRRAGIVVAHGLFESNQFVDAEMAYQDALRQSGHDAKTTQALRERLALSIYRQAEQQRDAGQILVAAALFRKISAAVPDASMIAAAEIDASALLLKAQRWGEAIGILEGFLKRFPSHTLAADVPTRLAHAYENDGQYLRASDTFEKLSLEEKDPDLARQMLHRSAELRLKGDRQADALATWDRYLKRFPTPLEPATEIRQRLADFARQANQPAVRDRWLNDMVAEARKAGTEATPRVRYLAGGAALVLGDQSAREFEAIRLNLPLDKSLTDKRRAMESALKWYASAGGFGVAEVTTPATYKTAEINRRLARDLMQSERPGGLGKLELEQYNLLLEEQAQPFDDKAIALHELNHQRIQSGLYDEWIKNSLAALRTLDAARYDKVERNEDIFDWTPPPPPAAAPPVPTQPGIDSKPPADSLQEKKPNVPVR